MLARGSLTYDEVKFLIRSKNNFILVVVCEVVGLCSACPCGAHGGMCVWSAHTNDNVRPDPVPKSRLARSPEGAPTYGTAAIARRSARMKSGLTCSWLQRWSARHCPFWNSWHSDGVRHPGLPPPPPPAPRAAWAGAGQCPASVSNLREVPPGGGGHPQKNPPFNGISQKNSCRK